MFHVAYVPETDFDSSIPIHDKNLKAKGYNIFRAKRASNTKQRGLCIY